MGYSFSYSEWRKQQKEKEGATSPSATPTQTKPSQTEDNNSNKEYSFSYSAWREQQRSNTVEGWVQSANSLINDIQTYHSNWHANDDEEYSNLASRADTLLAKADSWRKQFAGNTEAINSINSVVSAIGDAKNYSWRSKDFFSQWDTEDAFKQYEASRKDYEAKMTLDTGSAKTEIEDLTTALNLHNEINRLLVQNTPAGGAAPGMDAQKADRSREIFAKQATYKAILEKYGLSRDDDLEALLSKKKTYLAQAERMQSQEALTNNALTAPDFEQYAQEGVEMGSKRTSWITFGNDLGYENDVVAWREKGVTLNEGGGWEANFYRNMTEEETKIYSYYLAKEGKEKAKEYLDSIEETVNQRIATGMYGTMEDNLAVEYVFGAMAGLDQFASGVGNLFSNEDYIPASAVQIASQMVREDVADRGALAQMGYDAVTTIANMAPSILTSVFVSSVASPVAGAALGKVIGGWAGNLTMGMSAAGNAYQEKLNAGYDKMQARAYSTMVGLSEIAMQKALGGISALSGGSEGIFQTIIGKVLPHADNALGKAALFLGGMMDEGLEEGLQEILTPWFENMFLHADANVDWGEVAYSSLLGFITAGVMDGITDGAGAVSTYATGKKLQAADISAARLAEIGTTFSSDSVAYQLAGKVDENTGAYTLGKLFNEIGATLTEQNVSELTEALVAKGMPEAIAEKNAKALAYVVEGGQVSDAMSAVIEKNDILAEVARTTLVDANTTLNQRTKGYNDVVMALAKEEANKKAGKKATAPAETTQEVADGNSSATAETASEGDLGVEDAKVASIASIKNGRVTVKMEDGTEVDVKEANISPEDGVRIENIASIDGISAEDANFILGTLRTSTGASAQTDSLGAKEAYKYGLYGFSEDHITKYGVFANSLSETQRKAIYEAGRAVRAQRAKLAPTKKTATKETGVYFDAGNGNVVAFKEAGFKTLTDKQKAGIQVAKILHSLGIGGDVYFFESRYNSKGQLVYTDKNGVERPAPNGWYSKDGSIHIDLNAGKGGNGFVLFTMAHELTHFIEQWSPAKYKLLADFLIENYEKGESMNALVRKKQDKLSRARGTSVSYAEAYSEVVADSMEAMLADGNVVEKLIELKAKDNSLFMKMKQFFDNLVQKIRNVYKGLTPDSTEGKAVMEMTDAVERIQQLFAEALVDASENFRGEITPGTDSVMYSAEGDPVAHATEDGTVQLSMRTYEESGRDALRKYLAKTKLTVAEQNEMMNGIEEIYQTCKEFKDQYAPFGSWSDAAVVRDTYGKPVFSVVTPNGDYKMNLDFSLVCKKRRVLDAVFNEMAKRGIIDDFELGQKSVVKINEIIRKYGFETACALCFVDAKRFRQASMADQFVGLYNELVNSLVPEEKRSSIAHFNFSGNKLVQNVDNGIDTWNASELDFSHIDHVLKTYESGTVEYKAAKYIKNNAEARKLLLRGDFMSSAGFDAVKTQNKNILSLYNSKKGTGGPKAAFGDVQYMNEVIQKARWWTPKKAYAVGGIRIQSFSDYVPRMVFDYVQMIYDLAATKLPAHAYTKEAAFAKQFGLTGVKINMSLIPAIADGGIAPGLDANGDYVWAGESFDYETAKEIQNAEGYTENCGTICVGVSKQHIRKLLSDPNIRMVIPYHKSGLNPIVAHMNKIAEFTDYTGSQNTLDRDGKKLDKDFDFNSALRKTGDPKAAIDEYLAWCDSHGYTAKFDEFRDHPNYYKLIEDFTLYDKNGEYVPQREVRAVFPTDASAFGSMKTLIKAGLEEDAIIEGRKEKRLGSIVDEIERTLPKTEAEIAETEVEQASMDIEAAGYYEDGTQFSMRVTDEDTLEFLNNQETITTYKTMQIVDGKLYPPMAARVEGQYEDYSVLGTWEQATERPELIKNGNKFKLDKGKGQGSIEAAYNPYMHSSNLVLNDQFSGAYTRDNLVTIECEVPVSEMTSGYHAQYAKDSVGWHAWHTGTVAGSLRKAKGIERQVFLSRWIKPVRIVPDAEVAAMYKELLDGTDVAVPDNVVTPMLLAELKKAGVQIKESGRVKYSTRDYAEVVDRAVEQFGTTTDFNEAGFILQSGKMLKFTDDNHRGERLYDHRAIGLVYGVDVDLKVNHGFNKESNEFLDEFVENGGIRFYPGDLEYNMDAGLQISGSKPLTRNQERTIRDFIEWKKEREENYVPSEDDFSWYSGPLALHIDFGAGADSPVFANKRASHALTYEGGQVNADRIIADIRHYYQTGETRQQSLVAQFRYSTRDSEGNELSKGQQEFFKGSKVRWGEKLMPVYHGTRKEFTVFDATKGYDENRIGGLLWAAKDSEYAEGFTSSYEPIVMKGYLNITNLLDIGDIDSYENYESRLQELADLVGLTPKELEAMAHYDDPVTYIYDITSSKEFRDRIIELGYDGVTALEGGLQTYGFVDSNQFKNIDNLNPTDDPDIRYSYRGVNKDGIEVYETSQRVMNLGWKARKAEYLNVMQNVYYGRTAKFERNGHAYYATFDQGSIRKPIYGDNRSSVDGVKALIKAGADGDVFELVENSRYTGSQKNKKNHTNADYFDYFVKTVQIDNKVFDLVADVEKKYGVNGGYVYTLALVDNKKIKASPAHGTPNSVPVKNAGNASGTTVAQSGTNVNQNSDRLDESVSNRSLLANAFEGAAQNDIERGKIEEYKSKIDLINAEERKLSELNEQIKELSFAKGPRDTAKIRSLQFEARQAANRINTLDKMLLRLEASKPLQDVLTREKEMVRRREKQKSKDALEAYREKTMKTQRELLEKWQDARKKGIEGRHKTEMRHKIKNVVNELNQFLLNGTKDKHVMIELQKAVAEALDVVNMDTVGAEQRIAKLQADMLKAKTPEQIQEIARKIDRIQMMGDKMSDKLKKLKAGYADIINSDDPLVANSHDEVIERKIEAVANSVGDTPLRDMTLSQLEDVYDLYKMVLHTIREANKSFKNAKREEISTLANRVMMEVEEVGGKKKYRHRFAEGISKFDWNNLKPVYAFNRIGSKTLSGIFDSVRTGEDVWAKDVSEAREYYLERSKKYGYDSWDFEKTYTFKSSSGMDFSLTLDQIMSLYAYSKREQAGDHLQYGGFVFDPKTEVVTKTKTGIKVKVNVTEATAYNLSPETLGEIISKLNAEQKGFVDEMQEYLSSTMGAKGNEVSLAMYGVKLFKEKFYFPLKSATQFMAKAKEQVQGEVKIKNSGFSKETAPKAKNPIVLSSFMDVWANHVNEMSMYHAFVLPMEDFYRVYNYKTPTDDTMATESVEMYLQNAYGAGATGYIDQLLKDLNGGARTDSRTGFISNWMGKFKKGAVFASLSVVVQQPSAIARAAALVDMKYFIGPKVDRSKHKALWAEVKQYAPVAIIKEMGYFDTNMGMSTVDFITGKEYSGFSAKMKALVKDSNYRDEILSKAPALADELAWCSIWEAVKRETKAKHKGMDTKSEAFLQEAGKRFTEVIVKTQVYDSVLSRSALMRSRDTGMKMVTAFMAEPTTSMNMVEDALIQAKRGNKRYAANAIGAVMAANILNSILVSFVYAGRDDDEDKTYWEKYIGTLTGEVLDSLNPGTYIPFIKDIISIMRGYDVERSDMAIISDLWTAWENLSKDNVSAYRKVEGFAGSIAQIFGLPVKNIMRDARGIYNTVMSFVNGQQTTAAGIGHAIKAAITGTDVSNKQQLYEAILSGDAEQIARVKSRYKDQVAIDSAIRYALRENDSRIHEAAVAWNEGDMSKYMRLAKEIIAEGHFSQDNVVLAIRAEANGMLPEEESSGSSSAKGLFTAEKFAIAIAQDDQAMAYAIKTDIIQTAQKNGKTAEEAEKSFNSSAKAELKDLFLTGEISGQEAIDALTTYCGAEEDDAMADVQYWEFTQEYPDVYADDAWFDKYYEDVASSGLAIDVYMDYRNQVKDITGDGKKERRMAVIHSLPITSAQKDALYFSEGWTESKLYEAPWH